MRCGRAASLPKWRADCSTPMRWGLTATPRDRRARFVGSVPRTGYVTTMSEDSMKRSAALAVFGLRVAYGAALIAAPAPLARRWLGPGAERAPVQVPLRALGVREIVLHAGGAFAVLRGRPVRPWLVASIAGDVGDIAWTALGREQLPPGAVGATAVVAGASAALSAGVAAAMDE